MKLDKIIAIRNNKTIFREDDKAIKVFDESFSKANVLNEALNQARIEETSLNVPKLFEVTKVMGKWAIVSEYIEGKTLAQLMEENPEKVEEYLNLFIEIQMNIYEQTAPLLNKLKDKMAMKISQTSFDATTRYELHTRLDSMPNEKKVCHGDLNPGNIIIRTDGTPFIIDWSHVTQGNACADVARTYLLFWLEGKLDMAEKYIDLFALKSDTPKQFIQKWIPIVAASQSVKGNEKEREFLTHLADVVEYE